MSISPNPGVAPSIGILGHQGMHIVHMDNRSQNNHTYVIKINKYFKKNIGLLWKLARISLLLTGWSVGVASTKEKKFFFSHLRRETGQATQNTLSTIE